MSRWLLSIAVLILTSCATIPRVPVLEEVFPGYKDLPKKEPVILIPGLFASKLVDDEGNIFWGERRSPFRWKRLNKELPLPIAGQDDLAKKENRLHGERITKSLIWLKHYYELRANLGLTEIMEGVAGYILGDINKPTREHNYYVFSYDWRKDNAKHAADLHDRIMAIKRAWGDPSLKVNIVAHSMGGLIARYYVKYGKRDILDLHWTPPPTFAGAKHINKLVVVGTPHMGSTMIAELLHSGLPSWRIRPRIHPETMLTWPSMYQLLPSQKGGLFLGPSKEPIKGFDIYNRASWEKYELGPYSENMNNRLERHYGEKAGLRGDQLKAFMTKALRRGRKFHDAIEKGEKTSRYPVKVIAFGGDCVSTPEYAWIKEKGSIVTDEKDLRIPGDGRVSRNSLVGKESSLLTKPSVHRTHVHLDFAMFICESHTTLTESPTFQDNLLYSLLSEGPPNYMEEN